MPKLYIFRAVGLPLDATTSDFDELQSFLEDGEKLNLVPDACAIVPSCSIADDSKTGMFGVRLPLPSFLSKDTTGSVWEFSLRGHDIQIDRNFFGFTQLYATEPEKPIIAEYVGQ